MLEHYTKNGKYKETKEPYPALGGKKAHNKMR